MSQLAVLYLVTVGALYLMTMFAMKKHLLEWRRPRRACPSCGSHAPCTCRYRR